MGRDTQQPYAEARVGRSSDRQTVSTNLPAMLGSPVRSGSSSLSGLRVMTAPAVLTATSRDTLSQNHPAKLSQILTHRNHETINTSYRPQLLSFE